MMNRNNLRRKLWEIRNKRRRGSAGGWIIRIMIPVAIFGMLGYITQFDPALITQIGNGLFPFIKSASQRELSVYGVFFAAGSIIVVFAEWDIGRAAVAGMDDE